MQCCSRPHSNLQSGLHCTERNSWFPITAAVLTCPAMTVWHMVRRSTP